MVFLLKLHRRIHIVMLRKQQRKESRKEQVQPLLPLAKPLASLTSHASNLLSEKVAQLYKRPTFVTYSVPTAPHTITPNQVWILWRSTFTERSLSRNPSCSRRAKPALMLIRQHRPNYQKCQYLPRHITLRAATSPATGSRLVDCSRS